MNTTPITTNRGVAEVFRRGWRHYQEEHGTQPPQHYNVVRDIMNCRTEVLGGHVYRCDSCTHELSLWNSCRSRHCPNCQALARAAWVEKRMQEVLPVPYFHVVFTLPHEFNDFALRNKCLVYNLFFRAVSRTLLKLGADPNRLGGESGCILVLHTWTQLLRYHIHLHCIVPGGALNPDHTRWIPANRKYRTKIETWIRFASGESKSIFSFSVR